MNVLGIGRNFIEKRNERGVSFLWNAPRIIDSGSDIVLKKDEILSNYRLG